MRKIINFFKRYKSQHHGEPKGKDAEHHYLLERLKDIGDELDLLHNTILKVKDRKRSNEKQEILRKAWLR